MARRTTKSAESAPAVSESTSTDTTEETAVSESTTEATASTEAAPATDKTEPDLTAFLSVVSEAVNEADTSTGEVPEANLTAVTGAYRSLEGLPAKNAAKKAVNEFMKNFMNEGNLPVARAYLNISEKALIAASGGGSKTSTPADPTENFVQRIATLTLAYQLGVVSVPEGVNDGWDEKVNELVESSREAANTLQAWNEADPETRGEEPEASAVVRNAVKLASGKAAKAGVSRGGGTFTGERRDIGEHIINAFEGKDEGTFLTIAEIRNTKSDEYGDNPPSAGAISARLFPKSGNSTMVKVGIEPTTQDGKKGATKVAVPDEA